MRSNFSSPVPDILKKSFVQFDPEIIFAGIRLLFGEPAEPFGYIVLLIFIELTDGLNRLDLESLFIVVPGFQTIPLGNLSLGHLGSKPEHLETEA